MATKLKTIDRGQLKRGDTACFAYVFTQPYAGVDWTTVTIDCALTAETSPASNTGAVATRTAQSLTVDSSNTATYLFQLTPAEAANLVVGSIYHDECQLKQGTTAVATRITGKVVIVQDYVI